MRIFVQFLQVNKKHTFTTYLSRLCEGATEIFNAKTQSCKEKMGSLAFRGVLHFFTTEITESTEKKPFKISVRSVVNGFTPLNPEEPKNVNLSVFATLC